MFLKEISQQYIREYLSNKYDIIYVAPGCALNPINNNDNNISEFTQQNLKCLGKYQNRLHILIDPELDTINLGSLGPKLILVEANEHIRVFESEDETLTVLAISDYIDYDKNFDTIKLICNFVLENKIKMIMQDFTGRDLTYYYIKLIKLFGKERMLENIIFDITQMYEGNCFPDVDLDVLIDTNGNFIQSKYDKININTVKDYWSMIRNLAYMIRNPRERHYNSIKICVTFIIYDMINFNFEVDIQEITYIFYIIVN